MTRFARLIVVFCIFIRLALSMENIGHTNTTTKSLNDNSFSAVSNRDLDFLVNIKTEFFDQKFDHLDGTNSETWKQQYFIVDEFYNEDKEEKSPIFFMIGRNRPIFSDDIVNGIWIKWAKKFKALCFLIEHRFYGSSHLTKDTSTENLKKYLNVRQAVSDYAVFITTMKDDWNLTDQNKWIVFGGDYAGTLAVLLKYYNPQLVDGLVASSAYFPSEFFEPEYYGRVFVVLKKQKPGDFGLRCYYNIEMALTTLGYKLDSRDEKICNEIRNAFDLETDFNCTNNLHTSLLFEQIVSNIASIIVTNNQDKLKLLCKSLDGKSTFRRLAKSLENILVMINANYEKLVGHVRKTNLNSNSASIRLWLYQKCTELGGFQVPLTETQGFLGFNRQYIMKFYCTEPFGLYNDTTESSNFFDLNYFRQFFYSKTVFVEGESDLLLETRIPKFHKSNKFIVIEDTGRCEDMKVYGSLTPPLIKNAQTRIQKLIKKWIDD